MKTRFFKKALAIFITASVVFSYGCAPTSSHTHSFTKKASKEQYLKEDATCSHGSIYYYSCECGEKGTETYDNLVTKACIMTAEVVNEKYFKKEATCQKGAEYFKSCSVCGKASTRDTFFANELGNHSYTEEKPDGMFIKDEATEEKSAVYYKSCACGQKGQDTFVFGEPLRAYTNEEKANYMPTSLTVSLYDSASSIYGFTYNTVLQPLRPVIQISENKDFSEFEEYPAHTQKQTTVTQAINGKFIDYYIVKAEIELTAGKTYYYRAYDKYVDVGTPKTSITAKDTSATKFTFAHVSDSQSSENTGVHFRNTLANVTLSSDFIVHTGDVVESSLYENEWTNMLDSNFDYLSKIPMMAISGNHETTYKNGNNETFKHFNNKIPEQDTILGYYYSFTYGNAKFIMLNTNRLDSNKLTNDQYEWLIEELKNNTATWTIVALHNPMYSVGAYGSNPQKNQISLALREQLNDIFVEYGVDIVLQGHDHLFSKTHPLTNGGTVATPTYREVNGISYTVSPQGVIYVMSGTAGEQTRGVYNKNSNLYDFALDSKKSSWAEFSIDGNTVTVSVKYDKNGVPTEVYNWGIIKE